MTGLICLTLMLLALARPAQLWAAADQREEFLDANSRERQERNAKQLKARERLETLKGDQQSNQAREQMDQIKRQQTDPIAGPAPHANEPAVDTLQNEQQLKRSQTDQQINRMEREPDMLRQQQQINALERQQHIRSLQEQLQRNQLETDLERLRHQQQNLR